jgi:diamine N-acetyltransferase
MSTLIRPAQISDFADYSRLYLEINDLHAAAHPHLFRATSLPPRDQEDFQIQLEDNTQAIFMAEVDGEPAGFVNVILRQSPPLDILVPRCFAVVDSVSVAQPYRRLGVGQALMQRAEAWAVQKAAASLELNVFEFNQGAVAFYEELGFVTLSRKMQKRLD